MNEGQQIENDDLPIFSLRLDDPGPRPEQLFGLLRLVTGATPAAAKSMAETPGVEIAKGCRMELNRVIDQLTVCGASFRLEVIDS